MLWSNYHSLILSREGFILTLSILPCSHGLMMRRMSVVHQNLGGIGKSIPSSFTLRKSPGSREISWVSGTDFPIPPLFWWSTDTFPQNIHLTWFHVCNFSPEIICVKGTNFHDESMSAALPVKSFPTLPLTLQSQRHHCSHFEWEKFEIVSFTHPKLIAQPDHPCHCYLDFYDDHPHLSKPDNRAI